MDHVTLTYRDQLIGRLNGAGSLSLKTGGKYCEADILLSYVVRCPRAEADAALEMDELFERFLIFGSAVDVTEQEG